MAVLDGAAVIAKLGEGHPEIPVIAASGLTANAQAMQPGQDGVRFFLTKPFSASELLQAVRIALDDAKAAPTR